MEIVFLLLILLGGLLFFVAVILPLVLWTHIKDLQRLVRSLQTRVDSLEATRGAEAVVETRQPTAAAPAVPEPSAAPERAPEVVEQPAIVHIPEVAATQAGGGHTESNLEALIAGRWLNRIGLVLVFFAVAYFIQWSIDNNWIGPTGQIASGVVIGAALLVASQFMLRRGYVYFSEGVTGLGAAVLYLALWAGCNYYHLFSQTAGLAGMVAVTGAVVAIAVGRNSQRIASLALAGGFLSPALASSGANAQVALFTYIAVLNGGLLALAWNKTWRWLELPAFVFTLIYFWAWYDQYYYVDEPIGRTLAFATLFFVEFSALSIIRARRIGVIFPEQVALVLLNGPLYLLTLLRLVYEISRWGATFATLALAAAHLAIFRAIPESSQAAKQARLTRLLFAGLALTFVTLAIPIRLEGRWITLAFGIEGAVLMWTGFRAGVWPLRAAAFLLFVFIAMRLAIEAPSGGRFLFNQRFATLLATAACYGAALWFASRHRDTIDRREAVLFSVLGVATNVIVLWALSAETYEYFSPRPGVAFIPVRMTAQLARQLTLSIVWTVYASILIVAGVRRHQAALRWQALALFGMTVVKVFLSDMSFLSGGYRVASSVVVGLVLLAVSFVYQRQLVVRKAESAR